MEETTTPNIYKECVAIIKHLMAHDYLYFESAVVVKRTPHTPPVNVWAVCVDPKDTIYLMDADEQWSDLSASEVKQTPLLVNSLYQRLKHMELFYGK